MAMNDDGRPTSTTRKTWVTRIVGVFATVSTIGVGILGYLETETNAQLSSLADQVQALETCVDTGDIGRIVNQLVDVDFLSQDNTCPGEGLALGELNQQVAIIRECLGMTVADNSSPIKASTKGENCGKLNPGLLAVEPERREMAQQREDEILKEYVPKLIKEEEEFREALAMISVMFPDQTKEILWRVIKTLDKDKEPILYKRLAHALESAKSLDSDTGPWIIVLLQDRSRDRVDNLANEAKGADLPQVETYQFPFADQEVFAASFGFFSTEMDAHFALTGLEPKLGRHGFVADRSQWCTNNRRILEESVDQGVFLCSVEG